MGNSFVLFDVSIVISHGQFHCGNRGHTQNADFPWEKGLVEPQLIETLRLRFFGISHELRTSRSHVTSALPSGLYVKTTL